MSRTNTIMESDVPFTAEILLTEPDEVNVPDILLLALLAIIKLPAVGLKLGFAG